MTWATIYCCNHLREVEDLKKENAKLRQALDLAILEFKGISFAKEICDGLSFSDAQIISETALSKISSILGEKK